jgi:hypothetical protein
MEERRIDLAEKNIYEALTSDDSRLRDAASMFTIRNSHGGWITSSTSAAELFRQRRGERPARSGFQVARGRRRQARPRQPK